MEDIDRADNLGTADVDRADQAYIANKSHKM